MGSKQTLLTALGSDDWKRKEGTENEKKKTGEKQEMKEEGVSQERRGKVRRLEKR